MMRRVHDRARVHVSIGMMFLAAAGMFANALLGKYNASHGLTLEKIAQDYQSQYKQRKEG